MLLTAHDTKERWETSFSEQIALQAYNTAPVEALVRTLSYYFRGHYTNAELATLHFLELGCGAAPNLIWLAQKGMTVSGIDISPTALQLARQNLERAACDHRIGMLLESSVSDVPLASESFDGIIESCVFQHLNKDDRLHAFQEVRRLLKPGGVFVGYMLDVRHSVFQEKQAEQLDDDLGTLILRDGSSNVHLTNIGLSHFYQRQEIIEYLAGFSIVDPCLSAYYLPTEEAEKRGYTDYLQSMWIVYAIK